MNRFLSIGEAAERLGVSITTLRRWEALGRLVPKRTQAGHRRYDAALIESLYGAHAQEKTDGRTIAYARVSSSDQKADLEKQKEILELFCTGRGWRFEMISDFGSGMNYHKKGLLQLLNILVNEDVERLVITQKDRLLRFGAELVFAVCEAKMWKWSLSTKAVTHPLTKISPKTCSRSSRFSMRVCMVLETEKTSN